MAVAVAEGRNAQPTLGAESESGSEDALSPRLLQPVVGELGWDYPSTLGAHFPSQILVPAAKLLFP